MSNSEVSQYALSAKVIREITSSLRTSKKCSIRKITNANQVDFGTLPACCQ